MKKSFFFALLSAVSINMSAQLEINSDGKAIVGRSNYTDIALQSLGCIYVPLLGNEELVHSVSTGSQSIVQKAAVYGQAVSETQGLIYATCGVKGIAGNGAAGFNYGLMGVLSGSADGAGVYGTTNFSCPIILGRYAGYFDGDVRITGSLNAPDGLIHSCALMGTMEPQVSAGQVEHAQALSDRLAGIDVLKTTKTVTTGALSSESETTERTHYAFVAENMSELFPELVSESADGETNVDYMELIPVLVKSVGELTKRVNELEGENARLKQAMMQSAIGGTSQSGSDGIAYGLTGLRKSQMSGVSIRKGKKTATNR